jgi:DNA-binding IclR family transcriptional regulator
MTQQVGRAAQILSILGSGPPRLGVTEIADRAGLAKPTVHRFLRTLEKHGLVAQDRGTGKYSLGPVVLRLSSAYLTGSELRARSLPWAESLARNADEAVWVAGLCSSRVTVLHHVLRPGRAVQIPEVGAVIPWHASAFGHVIVAHLPAAQQAGALAGGLAPLTDRTKTTHAELSRILARVRRQGYAVENQEAAIGSASIAAPVLGPAGAIGVIGAATRLLAPETRDELVRIVRAAALAISSDLKTT